MKKLISTRMKAVLVILGLACATAFFGIVFYIRLFTLPFCSRTPVSEEDGVEFYHPSSTLGNTLLGSKTQLSCPEAERSFFEWYAIRIHVENYLMEAMLGTQGVDRGWAITGIHIRDQKTVKTLVTNVELARDVKWAASGADVSMLSHGPSKGWEKSYLRYEKEAGLFRFKVVTRERTLEGAIKPLTPGVFLKDIGADVTRPGAWYQYANVVIMGEARGKVTDYELGQPVVREFMEEPGRAYIEHMWGNMDMNHFYWEMMEFGDLDEGVDLFGGQYENQRRQIRSFMSVLYRGKVSLSFMNGHQGQRARIVYSRFAERGGILSPQLIDVYAFHESSPGYINMGGPVLSAQLDWLSATLYGKAKGPGVSLDWNRDPHSSVIDFYKGDQVHDRHPSCPVIKSKSCEAEGCRIELEKTPAKEKIEYWIIRSDAGPRCGRGIPVGVIGYGIKNEEAPQKRTGDQSLAFLDREGSEDSFYSIVPVAVPDTLLHKRLQAGYARCSEPPERGEPVALPGALREAVEKPPLTFSGPRASEDSGLSLSRRLRPRGPGTVVRFVAA